MSGLYMLSTHAHAVLLQHVRTLPNETMPIELEPKNSLNAGPRHADEASRPPMKFQNDGAAIGPAPIVEPTGNLWRMIVTKVQAIPSVNGGARPAF